MSSIPSFRPSLVLVVVDGECFHWRAARTVKVPFGADPLVVLSDGVGDGRDLPGRLFLVEDEASARRVAAIRPGAAVVTVDDVTGVSVSSALSRIGVAIGCSPCERLLGLCDLLRWWPDAVPAVMKLRQMDWAVVRVVSKKQPTGFVAGKSGAFFRVVPTHAIRAALGRIESGVVSRDVVDEVLSLSAVPVIKIKDVEVRRGLRLGDRFNETLF